MTEPNIARRMLVAAAAVLAALAVATPPASAANHNGSAWVGAWAGAVQAPTAGGWTGPNWSQDGFDNHSVRQVVRVSTGGPVLRLRIANTYGTAPLRLTGATVGKAGAGAEVRPATVRPVRFGHQPSAVVPAGEQLASDPVRLWTSPLDRLAVTLYFAEPTGPATMHLTANENSYRATGDHRFDRGSEAFTETSMSWYYLAGVDVAPWSPRQRGAVVAFGDSITDGAGSTPGADNRFPDELAERLAAAHRPRGVLNSGISGNRVLNDSTCLGEDAVARFERDVLDQTAVRTVIVLEGINDIGFSELPPQECTVPNPRVTAAELIEGHRALIRAARAEGVRVIGATLLPYEGAMYYTPEGEAVRDALNEWIRTSGEYDAVVDLDRALAAPDDPDRLNPAYDSGDALHPNDAGMRAMANAINLRTL